MKRCGIYDYQVTYGGWPEELGWIYKIYSQDEKPNLIRESDEIFETESRAELAAIGHISLLENGEG